MILIGNRFKNLHLLRLLSFVKFNQRRATTVILLLWGLEYVPRASSDSSTEWTLFLGETSAWALFLLLGSVIGIPRASSYCAFGSLG